MIGYNRVMSMNEAQGNLTKSTRDLLLHWQRTRTYWRDARAEAFEKAVLEPLEAEVRQAGAAIARMNQSLREARMRVAARPEPQ